MDKKSTPLFIYLSTIRKPFYAKIDDMERICVRCAIPIASAYSGSAFGHCLARDVLNGRKHVRELCPRCGAYLFYTDQGEAYYSWLQ